MKLTKETLDSEFKRFGFNRIPVSKQIIRWVHMGVNDRSTIEINRTQNALIVDHSIRIIGRPNRWETVPFGIMSPLIEIVGEACRLYQISLNTREDNEDWSECNIIPGTSGGDVVDLSTRKVTNECN